MASSLNGVFAGRSSVADKNTETVYGFFAPLLIGFYESCGFWEGFFAHPYLREEGLWCSHYTLLNF